MHEPGIRSRIRANAIRFKPAPSQRCLSQTSVQYVCNLRTDIVDFLQMLAHRVQSDEGLRAHLATVRSNAFVLQHVPMQIVCTAEVKKKDDKFDKKRLLQPPSDRLIVI